MATQLRLGLEHGVNVPDPTWKQVVEAIGRLDGDAFSEVSLHLVGQGALFVGGGNKVEDEKRYIVTYLPENPGLPSLTLTDSSLTGPKVELTVQVTAEFRAEQCIRLPLVLRAFEHFFHMKELPACLTWESDRR